MSSRTLTYVAGITRRHRASIGSPWRKLNPGQQALLVLVYLRKGETFAEVAAGFGAGTSTAWLYVNETVALLAARAPKLRTAVRDAKKAGCAYVVLDGTLIPVDRVAADRPFYSGKHRKHGMNLQVIASPDGDILWVSAALPGSVHDKKAEWIWGVLAELEAAGVVTLADKGNKAETKTMLPAIEAFMAAHQLPDVTVVADAGMISDANMKAIEATGHSFIPGMKVPGVPCVVDRWRREHPGEEIPGGHVFTQPWPAGPKDKHRDQLIY